MSSEDDIRRLQAETWPDMNGCDQANMPVHRTVRLEVPLHASAAILQSARLLRALADNLERNHSLNAPNLSERQLITLQLDYLEGSQLQLNALCPWRREFKRRMKTVLKGQEFSDNTVVLRQHKG